MNIHTSCYISTSFLPSFGYVRFCSCFSIFEQFPLPQRPQVSFSGLDESQGTFLLRPFILFFFSLCLGLFMFRLSLGCYAYGLWCHVETLWVGLNHMLICMERFFLLIFKVKYIIWEYLSLKCFEVNLNLHIYCCISTLCSPFLGNVRLCFYFYIFQQKLHWPFSSNIKLYIYLIWDISSLFEVSFEL